MITQWCELNAPVFEREAELASVHFEVTVYQEFLPNGSGDPMPGQQRIGLKMANLESLPITYTGRYILQTSRGQLDFFRTGEDAVTAIGMPRSGTGRQFMGLPN